MNAKFTHKLNPRYIETDQGGRIHHASFVAWLEEARVAFLTDRGVAYHEVEAQGYILVVRGLEIKYKAAVNFGTPVEIKTRVAKLGRASVDFEYELFQNGVLCTTAVTQLACVDRDGKPTAMPATLSSQLTLKAV